MKASLILFVVALVLIVLDFIEASPFPRAQAKGKDNNAKGKLTAAAAAKDNAKGKVTAAAAAKDNAKGKVTAAAAAKDNAKGNVKGNAANDISAQSQIDTANKADKNAKNAQFSAPPSKKSSANICNQSKLTNAKGKQLPGANCVTTQIGEIPAENQMTSSVILNPQNGQTIKANTKFTVQVKVANLNTGFFADPAVNYNTFSQELDAGGVISGHCHVSIQKIINPNQPLDAQKTDFFKGLNDKANNGILSTDVVDDQGKPGLSAGQYRLCSMAGSFSHQPLVMPIAKRGPQDDCIRFTVQ